MVGKVGGLGSGGKREGAGGRGGKEATGTLSGGLPEGHNLCVDQTEDDAKEGKPGGEAAMVLLSTQTAAKLIKDILVDMKVPIEDPVLLTGDNAYLNDAAIRGFGVKHCISHTHPLAIL